jgi:hypothetical protein
MSSGPETRRSKLDPARLERKRATDRESQRVIRARTKSYIEHLESTIQQLEQSATDHRTRSLVQTVAEQHAEIERLRGVIRTVNRMLGDVARPGMEIVLNAAHDSHILFTDVAESPPVAADMSEPAGTGSSQILTSTLLDRSYEYGSETAPSIVSQPSHDPFWAPLTNYLACGNGTGNYLGTLSMEFASIQSDISFCPLTSAEEDEDVAIRSVTHGWHATEQRHALDPGWKLLQALDEGLFYRSGSVERMAILRVMRLTLLVGAYEFNL